LSNRAIIAISIIANFRLRMVCDFRISLPMETVSERIIDALGGTTAVSRMSDAPISTVHSWRKNGIPRSRLAHLRLIAEREAIRLDWDTGRSLSGGDGDTADHAATDTTAEAALS
jgi:hypothetical protein